MDNDKYTTMRVKTVCENKLGITFKGKRSKECNGWFVHAGKKISRVTVPKGRKPIPQKTYKKMAEQLILSVEDFDDLLACPLSLDDYRAILSKKKLL